MKKIVFWNTVLAIPVFFVVFFCIETISFGRSVFSSQITEGDILSLLGFFLASLFVTLVPFFLSIKSVRLLYIAISVFFALLVSLSFFLLDGFHDFFDDNSGMFGRLGDAVLAIAIFWFLVSFLGVYVVIQVLLKFPRLQKLLLYIELFVLTLGVGVLGFFQIQSLSIERVGYDGSETCNQALTNELYVDCIDFVSKKMAEVSSGEDLVDRYDILCRSAQGDARKSSCFYFAHISLPIGNNLCLRFSDDVTKALCTENEMRNYLEKKYGYPNETNYETDAGGLDFCKEKYVILKNVAGYFPDMVHSFYPNDFEYREKLQFMSSCFETTAGFDHCDEIPVQPFRDRCYLELSSINQDYCSKIGNASASESCNRCREQGDCNF